ESPESLLSGPRTQTQTGITCLGGLLRRRYPQLGSLLPCSRGPQGMGRSELLAGPSRCSDTTDGMRHQAANLTDKVHSRPGSEQMLMTGETRARENGTPPPTMGDGERLPCPWGSVNLRA